MTVHHRGYILQQSEYNNHYMIIYDNGKEARVVLHASCTEPLSEEEAKEHIDNYLMMKERLFQ